MVLPIHSSFFFHFNGLNRRSPGIRRAVRPSAGRPIFDGQKLWPGRRFLGAARSQGQASGRAATGLAGRNGLFGRWIKKKRCWFWYGNVWRDVNRGIFVNRNDVLLLFDMKLCLRGYKNLGDDGVMINLWIANERGPNGWLRDGLQLL